jgi:predicted nucleic acid-binding protein
LLETKYVVDTNVIVAWLLKPDGLSGKIIRSLELELHTPYKTVDELWKNKSEWDRKNSRVDLGRFIDQLGYYIRVQPTDFNSPHVLEARNLMHDVDPDDSEFVALAIMLDMPIWSYDPDLRRQSRVKVVTSDYILRNSHEVPGLWEVLKKEYSARVGKQFQGRMTGLNPQDTETGNI